MAPTSPKPRLIAADTNFLFDFARGDDTAWDALTLIRSRIENSRFVIMPTTVHELAFIVRNGESQEVRDLAYKAATSLRQTDWNITPLNYLPVGHGISEQIARKLAERRLIPPEEINDALTLAEAALAEVTLLVSSDKHLKDIDPTALKLLLDECHVSTPLIASPWKIVKKFFV